MKNYTLVLLLGIVSTSSFAANANPQPLAPIRRPAAEGQSLVIEPSWWKANEYKWQIGYENAATTSTGILGQNVMTGGYWFNQDWGLDVYLGYTKGASTATESVAESVPNTLANPNTKTIQTTYSGTNTARTIAVGAGLKYRVYQTDWFQFNLGLVAAFFPGGKVDYPATSVGGVASTKTETYTNAGDTTNKTTTETNLGTVNVDTASSFAIGPRLATEFYIKWFPHLAVGFATGILSSFGGDVTTTTDTVSRTYTTVNGVDQAATGTPSTSHTVSTTRPGTRETTFGLGGTVFALTGNFSIRYVW